MERLGPELASRLAGVGNRRRLSRGGPLFMEGEIADRVAVVVEGRLKLITVSTSGSESVLAIFGPGELVGEVSVFDGSPRSATVTALDRAELIIVPRREFEQFLADNGAAALVLIRQLCDRLRSSNETRSDISGESVAVRVARRLSALSQEQGSSAGTEGVELLVSQADLAGWVGASREAVARALGDLRADGVLRTGRGRIVIDDLDALVDRAR